MDRTKALYGHRTQAYRETNYLREKTKVLDRTKALYGPRTQAYGETNYLRKNKGFGHNLDIVWSSDSIPWRGYPLIIGLIPRQNGIPGLSSDPRYQGN